MTRVNLIDPELLSDQHLLAEYREIPRVITGAENASASSMKGRNTEYRMGTGHVKFFYDKLDFIKHRHGLLVCEMVKRGLNATIHLDSSSGSWWAPSRDEMQVNKDRIIERLSDSKQTPRYYGKPTTRSGMVEIVARG